jgi:predicted  nucleic acid-binding Zn-ribbon protein
VESAKKDLDLMIRLQEVYDRISKAIMERSTAPPEVRKLQEDNERRKEELEQLEANVKEHEEELRKVRKQEGEWTVELEHFQKQKAMVTNEREFSAVISEIDYANKALEENSGRRKELEAELAKLNDEIESRRKARPEEEEAQREVVGLWEQRKVTLKDSIHEMALQAQKIEGQLAPNHRSRFLRLLKSKQGTAISAVVEGSCSVCHFSLRPHLQQRVRRAQELISCEHCHRILFFADMQGHQEKQPEQPAQEPAQK